MGKRSDRIEALRRIAKLDTPEGAVARRMLADPPKWKDSERPARPLHESESARLHAKTFRGFSVNLDMGDFSAFGRAGFATREAASGLHDMADAMAAAMGLGKCPRCGKSTFRNDICGLCAAGYGPKASTAPPEPPRRAKTWPTNCQHCTQPLSGRVVCPTCQRVNFPE